MIEANLKIVSRRTMSAASEAMISMKEHQSIVAAYQKRIALLNQELQQFKKRDLSEESYLNQNEIEFEHKIRQSTMILDDLIGISDDIEDALTEDEFEDSPNRNERKITKSQMDHNRRATSLIIEDLIGINDDFIDDESQSFSTSFSNADDDNDATNEQQSIEDLQNKSKEEIDRIYQSKLKLIASLSLELDKMRSIIIKQQKQINQFSKMH